ncbi:MAG: hypothetical protein AAGI01_14230 [Myxococcota bacterium]
MATKTPRFVIHRHVALLLCENEAVLEETLHDVDLDGVPLQRIGPRAVVAPAPYLERLRDALHERDVFPKIIRSRS